MPHIVLQTEWNPSELLVCEWIKKGVSYPHRKVFRASSKNHKHLFLIFFYFCKVLKGRVRDRNANHKNVERKGFAKGPPCDPDGE